MGLDSRRASNSSLAANKRRRIEISSYELWISKYVGHNDYRTQYQSYVGQNDHRTQYQSMLVRMITEVNIKVI